MASWELFDKVNKEPYNLHTRWVSDFAAKWPEGSWIKIGIILTCIAMALLYREKLRALPPALRHSGEAWFHHIVPLLLIFGLILVISYDTSHPRWQWVTRGIWPFQYKELVHAPKNPEDWKIEWYHRLGFRIFVAGFLAAVAGGLVIRRMRRLQPPAPMDWLIFIATLASAGWIFTTVHSIPGIPQRFLLATVFIRLWREAGMPTVPDTPPHRSDPSVLRNA